MRDWGKRCGDCKHWMSHYECSFEHYDYEAGRWYGPNMGSPGCEKFDKKIYIDTPRGGFEWLDISPPVPTFDELCQEAQHDG